MQRKTSISRPTKVTHSQVAEVSTLVVDVIRADQYEYRISKRCVPILLRLLIVPPIITV